MLSRTTRNFDKEIFEEADAQPPVKRRSTFGEWQNSHKAKAVLCPWCHHAYCSCEDPDDSELDSDEEDRQRRPPIKCGYDITEAGQLYCCECRNRFRAQTPPGVFPYGHGVHDAMAGRHGAESPTEMTALPIMKIQQPGNPQNPVFNVRQPEQIHQPQTIHELRDAERFRRIEETARQPAEAEARSQQIAGESMAKDVQKREPEGGYVDSEGEHSDLTSSPASPPWSPPPSPPPSPPESPTPSPPESPPPSPPPSPPTSPDASSAEGTETPELPPLIAAVLPEHEADDADMDDEAENGDNQRRDGDDQTDSDDEASAGRIILY